MLDSYTKEWLALEIETKRLDEELGLLIHATLKNILENTDNRVIAIPTTAFEFSLDDPGDCDLLGRIDGWAAWATGTRQVFSNEAREKIGLKPRRNALQDALTKLIAKTR